MTVPVRSVGFCRLCGQQAFYDSEAGLFTVASQRLYFKCQGRVIKSLGHSVKGF